ncbi:MULTISPECIES: phosphatase PAP2 family protein [unclassified Nocardioides]|uniref:phosphatase PAP2 family protein n=1 Tax=unclassified Nocardioides TaxID=2615069 RepID=UPI000A41B838|nr:MULTISPECIES: phosphatase PAP2 family protein [unclassified Nocardioides]
MVRWLWIFKQAILVVSGVGAYFGVRGATEGSVDAAIQHAHLIVEWEQALGIYVEKTLQAPFTESALLATLANWVYIWGHWPVIGATMLWTGIWHRAVFLRLRDAMLVSGLLGMTIFVFYPVAPPRLAGLGFMDSVSERSLSYRVLQPPAFVDQYAAMPSLHAGWDLLIGIAIISASSSVALRAFGLAMPVLMAVAVVVTGNHFILDVAAGLLLALIGHAASVALEHRRVRRSPGRVLRVAS